MKKEEVEPFAKEIKKKEFEVSWVDRVVYSAKVIAKNEEEAEDMWMEGNYITESVVDTEFEDDSLSITLTE